MTNMILNKNPLDQFSWDERSWCKIDRKCVTVSSYADAQCCAALVNTVMCTNN